MDRAPGRLGGSPEGDVPLEKVEVIPLKKDDLLLVAADRERYVTALRDMTRLVLRNGRGELRRVLTSGSGDPLDSAFHGEGYRSLAAVPLLAGSRKLGSLVMLNRRPRGLGPAELKYFEGIGRFTATAIENMRTLTLWKEKGVMFDRYFEGTRDLWMIMGPDGTVGRASPSATSLTGRTPGEFIDGSADLASMAHDEDRADVEAALRAARAGEAPPEVDLRLLRPDGGLSWVRMGLLNLEVSRTGGSTTLVCVRDINKEKDREAGLREMQRDLEDSNRRLRDIISLWEQFSPPSDFDQFADSVLDVAMASSGAVMGGVLVMEPKLRALRLVTHRGLPADPHEDSKLIELRKRSDLIPLLQSSVIVSGPRLTGMEGALMGPISPSNMSAPMTVPVRAGEMALGMIVLAGAPECEKREGGIKMDSLMGLGRVLAAFIEAYTVNQEAGREMQAKREDLRFFSDMMTHDIHNLNTGALGSLEMALGSADEPARQERYLNRAFSQIVRSSVLIENVKRLRSTDEPYLVGDVDLDAAIRGSVANISVRYPDCALDPRYVPVPAVVRGDRGLVEDVLLNILDNCVKYSDTSTLRVEFDVDPLAPENRVGLVIRDWGGGLPPGQHGEYTGSLEGGSVRPRPGQLGRFLVGHQLKRLGGDLMVEDNIDGGEVVGTRFLLRFVRGGMR